MKKIRKIQFHFKINKDMVCYIDKVINKVMENFVALESLKLRSLSKNTSPSVGLHNLCRQAFHEMSNRRTDTTIIKRRFDSLSQKKLFINFVNFRHTLYLLPNEK